MSQISINDTTISYSIKGKGPNLLLLHDGFFSTKSWDTVRDHLAQSYTVIDYDRYGYGDSSHLTALPREIISFHVNELSLFADALNLDSFHLCGHCLGAAIALMYSHSHPGRVGKIIAEAPGLYTNEKILEKCDWVFQPWESLPIDFREEIISMHGREYAQTLWNHIRKHKTSYIMCPGYSIIKEVKKVKKEILFIYGDRDFYFDLEHARTAFNLHRSSQLWISPSTNHVVHREKPEDFIINVKRFLD